MTGRCLRARRYLLVLTSVATFGSVPADARKPRVLDNAVLRPSAAGELVTHRRDLALLSSRNREGVFAFMPYGKLTAQPPAPDTKAQDPSPSTNTPGEKTIWDGVFTSQQMTRGKKAAETYCASCHSVSDWTGPTFLSAWSGQPVTSLYDTLRTMPYDAPGSLSRTEYTDIIAYVLNLNGAPTGEEALPSDDSSLRKIVVTPARDR